MMQKKLNELVRSDLQRIVAIEPGDNGEAVLYRREEDGSTSRLTMPFHPWLLIGDLDLCQELTTASQLDALHGDGCFKVRAFFDNANAYDQALKTLRKVTRLSPSQGGKRFRIFSDYDQQFLTMHPARLFDGMTFAQLKRMQIDIETRTSGDKKHFPDPNIPGDEIILISIKDTDGLETCLSIKGSSEKAVLEQLVEIVRTRDPDVIEGHNIFNFDLEYIATRCKMFGVPLALGRDGSEPKVRDSRLTVSERIVPYKRYDIYGRHVVDTLHLVLLYDAIHRDMPSHSLKNAVKYFKVASPERTYVKGDDITNVFDSDTETLIAYCMDDARETDALSRILSPSYFYQTRLVPFSYQSCITRGTAARIDAMLCADYMQSNAALPYPGEAKAFQGALTEGDRQGVFNNVWHVDVRSLYPSIIISNEMCPANDTQGTFLRMLRELRSFRLAAKDARKTAAPEERDFYDALQSTFKILINSFYGYAGYALGTFNDFEMAAKVTETGRNILSGMRDFLENNGAIVIEMDTDGIYFSPADGTTDMEAFCAKLQSTLPDGIEIELDAQYKAMFGYKSKNYALLAQDDNVILSGAALKSRGTEAFQRNYMKDVITLLLHGHREQADQVYEKYAKAIEEHTLPIGDFAKREYLSTSTAVYQRKLAAGQTKRSAAYELALASGREYAQGDAVDFYVTGTKKSVSVTENSKLLSEADPNVRDENVPFYLAKLQQLRKKFLEEIK